MAQRFYSPLIKYTTDNIKALPGSLLYFYETGTTTPKTVYKDPDLLVPHENPVESDAAGVFEPIFLDGYYRVELQSNDNVTQTGWPIDYVGPDIDLEKPTSNSYLRGNANGTLEYRTIDQVKSDLTIPEYITGEFIPIIVGQSTPGIGTYTLQKGRYSKIGNLVWISVELQWGAHSGTGSFFVSGIPFPSLSTVDSLSVGFFRLNIGSGKQLCAYITNNFIRYDICDQVGGAATALQISPTGSLYTSGIYRVS